MKVGGNIEIGGTHGLVSGLGAAGVRTADDRAALARLDTYKVRHRKPLSQTWRAFLDNYVRDIVANNFLTVPTATFRILLCFIVLRHDRRMVVHSNVTANPTAAWTV